MSRLVLFFAGHSYDHLYTLSRAERELNYYWFMRVVKNHFAHHSELRFRMDEVNSFARGYDPMPGIWQFYYSERDTFAGKEACLFDPITPFGEARKRSKFMNAGKANHPHFIDHKRPVPKYTRRMRMGYKR